MDDALVTRREPHRLTWFWLVILTLLFPLVFHGCHLGGHDEDLLKVRWPLPAFSRL